MTLPEPAPEQAPMVFPYKDFLITVRWDFDEGKPVFDLGDMDPWGAVTILRRVASKIEGTLTWPRDINDDPEDDDLEEDEDE